MVPLLFARASADWVLFSCDIVRFGGGGCLSCMAKMGACVDRLVVARAVPPGVKGIMAAGACMGAGSELALGVKAEIEGESR